MNLFAMLLLGASGMFSLNRQLQMLQQNSYYPSRYYGWCKENYTVYAALSALLFCGVSLLYGNSRSLAFLILSAFVLTLRIPIAVKQSKKSVKKLAVTARVKRLYAAALIILGILLSICEIFHDSLAGVAAQMLFAALSSISPLLAASAWLLTYPIEKAVAGWYIKDAKRKLSEYENLKVIGITGSFGKTTAKFILKRILSEKFNVVATPQSFNTPMGIIRTVRSELKPQTQVFICEMGAKKSGDIKEICDIVSPDIGLITSVGPQHLDTFHSVDKVFETKFELAEAVRANGGEVFVNRASPGISERSGKLGVCRIFGMSPNCEFYAENIHCSRNGSKFELVLAGKRIDIETRLLGEHAVCDIVGAAAVAFSLGVSPSQIAFAVSGLKPTEHRLELKHGPGGSLLIDDAYNSNPEGCLGAIKVLASFEGMRRVIITPGLIELGENEYEYNYKLGLAAAESCDMIILVGKNRSKPMREAVESTDFDCSELYVAASFSEAMAIYSQTADENSIVLLENDLPDNYLN